MLHSPKYSIPLKVLTLNKVFHSCKRALHAGTARSKWRKYAQPDKLLYVAVSFLGYSGNFFFVVAYKINWKTAQACSLEMFVNRTVKSKISKLLRAVLSNPRLVFLPSPPWFNVLWIGWLWKKKYSKIVEIFTS